MKQFDVNVGKKSGATGAAPVIVGRVQTEEVEAVAKIFSTHPIFTLVPIPGDGWCILSSVAKGMSISLKALLEGVKGHVQSFCFKQREFLKNPTQFQRDWRALTIDGDMEDSPIHRLWAGDDGDLILPLIADYLHGKKKLQVWEIEGGQLVKRSDGGENDPQGSGSSEDEIHLLRTNDFLSHYDLLSRK